MPDYFWSMTPWHLSLAVEAMNEKYKNDHNRDAWFMWHSAILTRITEMPPLEHFEFHDAESEPTKEVPNIDETVIIARMKAYNERLAGGIK